MGVFGKAAVLAASGRLTKALVGKRIRASVPRIPRGDRRGAARRGETPDRRHEIETETVTRFNRKQILQMVLLVVLIYVALLFISTSTVPTFLCPN